MKLHFYPLLFSFLLFGFITSTKAVADVTLTSSAVPAAAITQGSQTNIVYIAKMDVTTQDVTVSNVHFTLSGTHDADDLSVVYVYFNPTSPSITGASILNGLNANFAAPHTYDVSVSRQITAGSSGYFIITVSTTVTASDGKTVVINGATDPVTFGFTTAPNITNNQTNIAGVQTIQAADVTLTSSAVPAATITQGSQTNIVYIAKMDVATEDVTVSNVHIPLSGTHDADDLSVVYVYFNPTSPSITGASLLNGLNANFAAPHTYDVSVSRQITAGSSGYFIITVSTTVTASDGKTVVINGATDPVTFGFTTAPNITNNQTNIAGVQTIQAADVTLTSSAVPAATITQGSQTNIVYIAKMDVATEDVTVSNVHIPLGGTHDADDLSVVYVYFNPTSPSITGASLLNGLNANFAAPHTYDVSVSRQITAGSSGYFIITVSTTVTASDGKTVVINGATDPVTFGFTTAPNITNNQTNIAGVQTIQAADVTLTSSAVPAATITQGSQTNIVYIAKMDVATEDVTVSNVHIPLGGTHDADDLSVVYVYFNPTSPSITGASLLNGLNANFAAPHTYDVSVSRQITAGSSGYFIITVSTTVTASDGKTVVINGATDPVTFGFTTAPNITNNQTNIAGVQTIQAADVTLTSSAIPASIIPQGSQTNVVYIAKMDVATEDVTVSNVHFTLSGTHDADDLTVVYVYFNPTSPSVTGASLLNGLNAPFAAPHTYDVSVSKQITAGSGGYFIITVSTTTTATIGHTILINGATDPVTFGFSTGPNITNNQTNAAGTVTIGFTLPVSLVSITAKLLDDKVQVSWATAQETDNAYFEIERSSDGINFKIIGKIKGNGTTSLAHSYSFADGLPEYGNNYYRLKQTDVDNHTRYSNIIKVSFSVLGIHISNVYPNPAKDLLKYIIQSPENKKLALHVSDLSGRTLVSKTITVVKGKNQMELNTSAFGSGHYQLIIVDQENNTRLIKQIIISR